MFRISDLRMRLKALFTPRTMERELSEEVAFHVEMATEKYVSDGLAPAEARRKALRAFGSMGRNKERARESWGVSWITDMLADLRFAVRSLRRDPVYAMVTVLTLGLGLGATTAIFSVVNSVVLQPLPYPDASALVSVGMASPESRVTSVSYPDFRDWREQVTSVEALGAHSEFESVFRFDDAAEHLFGEAMSADMFPMLGVPPLLGRWFTAEEDRIGGPPVILLEYGFWRGRFGSDSSIVGRTISVDDEPHTVLGVMPPQFDYPDPETRFWVPLREDAILRAVGIRSSGRGLGFLTVIGRLRPDGSRSEAERELGTLTMQATVAEGLPERSVVVRGLHEVSVGRARFMLFTFLGAVGLVLAIACVNVANLALARSATRSREVAVRSALGAGRSRLMRQFLAEAFLLAGLGGLVGLPIVFWVPGALAALGGEAIPRGAEIEIDITVLVFAGVLALVAGVAFGLVPALRSSKPELAPALKEGARRTGAGRETRILQQGLVVAEVALALVLLTGAGLLLNSFVRLTAVDNGFPIENVFTARVTLPSERYATDEAVLGFFDGLVERVAGLPGVTGVATSYSPPFAQANFRQRISVEGSEDAHWAGTVIVGENYFETSGVRLERGREFTRADRDGPPIAVINETMAARLWPDQNSIGKRFRLEDGISGSVESLDRRYFPQDWMTVVGVAADVRRQSLDAPAELEFYRPHAQMAWPGMALLVRTAGAPERLAIPIQRQVWDVDPGLAVTSVASMKQLVSRSVATPRFRMTLLAAFGGIAGLLAVIGVYGVVAFITSQQRRDIGIRIALGADRLRVVRDIVFSGMRMTLLGVAVGIVSAGVASRALAAMVYEITPYDPATYLIVALLLASIAMAACSIPALRASAVDPQIALRDE